MCWDAQSNFSGHTIQFNLASIKWASTALWALKKEPGEIVIHVLDI